MEQETLPGTERYFETIQPEWKKLAFTAEITRLLWRFSNADDITTVDPVVEANAEERVKRQLRFLRELDLVDDSENLTPNGIWLATVYRPPRQQSITPDEAALERKQELSEAEQEAFRGLLIGHHWLPMLATTHQLAEERVSARPHEEKHISSFAERLDHVEEYRDLSPGAWETRAAVHYHWFKSTNLAKEQGGIIELTDRGRDFHGRAEEYYPPEWSSTSTPKNN